MHATNTNDDEALGDDLLSGGEAIAGFWKMKERRARYLMGKGQLPGAFQIAGSWYQSKSAGRAAIKALAASSMPEEAK